MSKPDDYRAKAEECRLQADRAFSPLDKEAWLQLASRLAGDGVVARAISDRPIQHYRAVIGAPAKPRAKPSIRACASLA